METASSRITAGCNLIVTGDKASWSEHGGYALKMSLKGIEHVCCDQSYSLSLKHSSLGHRKPITQMNLWCWVTTIQIKDAATNHRALHHCTSGCSFVWILFYDSKHSGEGIFQAGWISADPWPFAVLKFRHNQPSWFALCIKHSTPCIKAKLNTKWIWWYIIAAGNWGWQNGMVKIRFT